MLISFSIAGSRATTVRSTPQIIADFSWSHQMLPNVLYTIEDDNNEKIKIKFVF